MPRPAAPSRSVSTVLAAWRWALRSRRESKGKVRTVFHASCPALLADSASRSPPDRPPVPLWRKVRTTSPISAPSLLLPPALYVSALIVTATMRDVPPICAPHAPRRPHRRSRPPAFAPAPRTVISVCVPLMHRSSSARSTIGARPRVPRPSLRCCTATVVPCCLCGSATEGARGPRASPASDGRAPSSGSSAQLSRAAGVGSSRSSRRLRCESKSTNHSQLVRCASGHVQVFWRGTRDRQRAPGATRRLTAMLVPRAHSVARTECYTHNAGRCARGAASTPGTSCEYVITYSCKTNIHVPSDTSGCALACVDVLHVLAFVALCLIFELVSVLILVVIGMHATHHLQQPGGQENHSVHAGRRGERRGDRIEGGDGGRGHTTRSPCTSQSECERDV